MLSLVLYKERRHLHVHVLTLCVTEMPRSRKSSRVKGTRLVQEICEEMEQ